MEGAVLLVPIVGSVGFFIMVMFIVWVANNAKNRRSQMQAEVQTRLIDKFSNAPEFVDFLNSDTGKQFLTGVDKMPQLMARDRIVGGVSRGVIMMLLGAAFIGIWIADSNIGFMYPGFILVGLGIGFFISTLVSLKLSQKFGLIGNDSPTAREVVGHGMGKRDATETQA
ncbi:MAG TPA: hypothetical protein VLC46_00850 [Thermoanaerobaculia bacterium]|jgi:hypothetical protein|nr:hypothetical protein [Thermoanaerobaculia bacterium]